MCGTACVKHSTFWFTIVSVFPISCVLTSGPASWKVGAGSCFSFTFCLCSVGLHTCHSVSPLLFLSRWSPHLPQCQSTASSSASVTVRVFIPTAPLNESIVNGYRRHCQNSCSYLLPQGFSLNPQVNTCLKWLQQLPLGLRCPNWMWPCTCYFLPQLGLPVNSRGGGPRSLTRRVSDWSTSVGCWDWLHVLDPARLSAAQWVSVHCVYHWQYLYPGPEACTPESRFGLAVRR